MNPLLKHDAKGMMNILVFRVCLHLIMKEQKNTIFQGFRKGNRIFIERKLRDEENFAFCDVNCEPFRKCKWEGEYFWEGIYIWETLQSNIEQKKNAILRNFKRSKKAFSIQETKMRGAHEEN